MASIFTTQTPTTTNAPDSTVVLGTVFYVDTSTTIDTVRYWKADATWDASSIAVAVYNPAGTQLATATRTQAAGDPVGWVLVSLGSSVALTSIGSSNLHTVSFKTGGTNLGHYAYTTNGLATALDNSPFHTPAQAGRYDYATTIIRPMNAVNTNYFADVVTVGSAPASPIYSISQYGSFH